MMKQISTLLVLALGFVWVTPALEARSDRDGSRSSSRPQMPQSSGPSKRSPMTGSKIARPQARPQPMPTARPETRPAFIPDRKPETRPVDRLPDSRPDLGNRPVNRPETRPANRLPDSRPTLDRPTGIRPATLPGMVTYPSRPDKGKPSRPNLPGGDRPHQGQINIDRSKHNNVHIDKVNLNRKNYALNRPGNKKHNWDTNKWGGKNSVWGNQINSGNKININVNNHFYSNNNYSYRPSYWGANPWWGASHAHRWHHGHWNYGWNSSYYRRHWYYRDQSFASGFMWGIGVWSLGNLIYDMGYQSYRNPYPAPPVQNTYITYAQPVSVAAAANPPGDSQVNELAETKSNEALGRSRSAFKQGDYLAASKYVDEAIALTPGDVTLHEYRSLVFFTLGKYADAAGVLNPVLASGPGWSWETMIDFYNGSEPYGDQLRRLESYVQNAPDQADARFLLGYHYMVCGHMEKSYGQFATAAELQPADSISRQLRDLTKSSIPDGGESETGPSIKPEPVPLDQLAGIWVSDRGQDGKVTFTMTEAGDYSWTFMNGENSSELKGTYGLNDMDLLVLTSDDVQMVSIIEMKESSKLHFTLVGAPDGDPGLGFVRN